MARDGIAVPADQSWSENPAYTTTARTVRPRAIRPMSFMMASNRPRTNQHSYPSERRLKHRVELSRLQEGTPFRQASVLLGCRYRGSEIREIFAMCAGST